MTFSSRGHSDHGDNDDILISTMRSLDLANRKNVLAQQEVTLSRNNQARLETQVYELDQSLATARKEIQRTLRAKKESDRELEQNNMDFQQERAMWAEREAELTRSLKFATRPLIVQEKLKDDGGVIDKEPSDAIPPHIQQQFAETSAAHARAIRAQEKITTDLRHQILALNQDLIERQQTSRLRQAELQSQITQARELNKSLMEENESFQLLLHEKSMNGEFMQTSIMKSTGYDDDTLPATQLVVGNNGSVNLADELTRAFSQFPPTPPQERSTESMLAEIESLTDEKTALQLYISKILSRIMEMPGFTSVLAADYSPKSAAQPESSAAVIKSNRNTRNVSSESNRGSDNESRGGENAQTLEQPPKPNVQTRPRSQSFLQSIFPRSKQPPPPLPTSTPSSTRGSSSEDDSSSTKSGKPMSFQEGVAIDDTPRTSYSSAEYGVVAHDQVLPMECEQLTTFEKPFTSQELRRQSSLHVTVRDRHQRRQTIGVTGVSHTKGSNHGRYVSESSTAVPTISSQGRRPAALPPMPELGHHAEEKSPTTPEERRQGRTIESEGTTDATKSPALSISTLDSSTTSSSSATAATPTTPVNGDAGIFRAFKRMSLFGANNPNPNLTATAPGGNSDIAEDLAQSPLTDNAV